MGLDRPVSAVFLEYSLRIQLTQWIWMQESPDVPHGYRSLRPAPLTGGGRLRDTILFWPRLR